MQIEDLCPTRRNRKDAVLEVLETAGGDFQLQRAGAAEPFRTQLRVLRICKRWQAEDGLSERGHQQGIGLKGEILCVIAEFKHQRPGGRRVREISLILHLDEELARRWSRRIHKSPE